MSSDFLTTELHSILPVSAHYWLFVAGTMRVRLEHAVQQRAVNSKSAVPIRVWSEAERFLILAQKGRKVEGKISEDYSIGLSAWMIASEILHDTGEKDPPAILQKLHTFATFLPTLKETRALTETEIEIAKQVHSFFRALETKGESGHESIP
jgi:hypothetical protein